jgi:hypothetical protein
MGLSSQRWSSARAGVFEELKPHVDARTRLVRLRADERRFERPQLIFNRGYSDFRVESENGEVSVMARRCSNPSA